MILSEVRNPLLMLQILVLRIQLRVWLYTMHLIDEVDYTAHAFVLHRICLYCVLVGDG
jgi:hypothetical protein